MESRSSDFPKTNVFNWWEDNCHVCIDGALHSLRLLILRITLMIGHSYYFTNCKIPWCCIAFNVFRRSRLKYATRISNISSNNWCILLLYLCEMLIILTWDNVWYLHFPWPIKVILKISMVALYPSNNNIFLRLFFSRQEKSSNYNYKFINNWSKWCFLLSHSWLKYSQVSITCAAVKYLSGNQNQLNNAV